MSYTQKTNEHDPRAANTNKDDESETDSIGLTAAEEMELDEYLVPKEARTPNKPKANPKHNQAPSTPNRKASKTSSKETSLPTPSSIYDYSPAKSNADGAGKNENPQTPKKKIGYFGGEAREFRSPGRHTPVRASWKSR